MATVIAVRHAILRTLGGWLLLAIVAFVFMEIANQAFPAHRLTPPAVAAAIGAGTAGILTFSLGKAVLRTVRSRRRPSGDQRPGPRLQGHGEAVFRLLEGCLTRGVEHVSGHVGKDDATGGQLGQVGLDVG